MVKSSPGSLLPVRNRMTGWPTFLLWRSTSSTKPGWWCVPKLRLKISMQVKPHDGVAAPAVPAVSAPAAPAPLTRVSVAAAARTLLLIDMDGFSSVSYMAVAPTPAGADATLSLRVPAQSFLPELTEVSTPELVVVHGGQDRADAVGETSDVVDHELRARTVGRVTVLRVGQHERVREVRVRAVDQRHVAVAQ